ncbi:MAG: IS1634 family transposase [Acidiferrobacteraceae bacterium]|jgi:hypothetical protein
MTFPRIITVGDRHYLQQVESVWVPEKGRSVTRVVAHLGPCDEAGNLLRPPRVRVEFVHSAFVVGSWTVLYAAAEELRIRAIAKEILGCTDLDACLVLGLALNQGTGRLPFYRVPELLRASPFLRWESLKEEQVERGALYHALDSVCPSTAGGWEDRGLALQARLNQEWRRGSREPAAAYYDITKQPYYGESNPYAEVGHDADGGVSNVLGFGMVVSREHHHPILCRPLPGSQSDARSVPDVVEMLRAEDLRGLRLIMDRGMTSKENVGRIVDAGYHVLGMVRGWNAATRRLASMWTGDELERHQYAVETSHGSSVFARALTVPLLGREEMRVAVVENLWKKDGEREGRELALRELQAGPVSSKRMQELRRVLAGMLVTSRGRRGARVNWKAVVQSRKLDGRFLLYGTDLSMDGREMYREYFRRDAIEKVFRTGKGELLLGPMRFQRKDRTEAQATVFYVAWLLWSWAERRLREKFPKMTLTEAFRTLERVTWVRFGAGEKVRDWTSRLTKDQETILKACRALRYLPTH